MSADLETLAFRTITHGQPLADDELKLIAPALVELIEELRADRQLLPAAFLAGFTPHVTVENSVLASTYSVLQRYWKGLIKVYPVPPVWLLRYVLATALIRLLDQDEASASVAALTLSDLHAHLSDTTERELREAILAQVRPQFEGVAKAAWELGAKADLLSPKKIELALPAETAAGVKAALKKALTPPAEEDFSPSTDWIEAVAGAVSQQIMQTTQSALQVISSKLPTQLKSAEQYHNEIQRILRRADLNERREALMWWLQTKYSHAQGASYRSFDPVVGALYMTRDFVAMTDGLVSKSVAAVLGEALLATYGVEVSVERSLNDLVIQWASHGVDSSFDSDAPMPMDAALGALSKNMEVAPSTLLGVDADTTVTLLTATAWLLNASMLRRLKV